MDSKLELTNIGCRFFLGVRDPATEELTRKSINLALVSYVVRSLPSVYNFRQFAAIRLYMLDSGLGIKGGQYNIFSTGCVNFIGSNTVDMAYTGAHMLANVLRDKTGICFEAFGLKVTFMSATVKLNYQVDIVKLAETVYNAELNWHKKKKFSGLIVRFESGEEGARYKITYIIYASGVCIISGLKNMQDADMHHNVLCQMTELYKVSPINPTTHQITMRLNYRLPDFLKQPIVRRLGGEVLLDEGNDDMERWIEQEDD